MFYTVLQIVFLILLFFFFEFFVVQIYNLIFRGYAPFIATKKKIIERLLEEIKIDDKATVIELGAGKAGFLQALRKEYKNIKLIGVEFSSVPCLIGKIQSAVTGSRIIFKKENIFKTDLSKADLIYCYLNVKTMNRLEEKFSKELAPNTQVVSYQFRLPNKKEEKMVDMGKNGKIWFYQF
ncbi:MAG: class I SAM-dependent methyltransferase [Patescibacteria group bacterium]|nr:class I SAM-dependent methyltransferase [Patescibacteria group bacterium]